MSTAFYENVLTLFLNDARFETWVKNANDALFWAGPRSKIDAKCCIDARFAFLTKTGKRTGCEPTARA